MDLIFYPYRAAMVLICVLILFVSNGHTMSSRSGPDTPVSHSGNADKGEELLGEGVTGKVTDLVGDPIEGASILPQSTDSPPLPIPDILIVTDTNGKYMWSLRPGSYRLTVIAEGYRPKTMPVQVKPGELMILDFVLE
jgi:hypothetical protein